MNVVRSGSLLVDWVTGLGGFPRGHLTELLGPDGCGKTSLLLATAGVVCQAGGIALYCDLDGLVDPAYAAKLGADAQVLLLHPQGEEELCNVMGAAFNEGWDLVVIDSTSSLPGAHPAFTLERLLKIFSLPLVASPTALVMVSRLLDGRPAGGGSGQRYASLRLQMAEAVLLRQGRARVGWQLEIHTETNHHAPVVRRSGGLQLTDAGFDRAWERLRLAQQMGLVVLSGGYHAGERFIGRSAEEAAASLPGDIVARLHEEVYGTAQVDGAALR